MSAILGLEQIELKNDFGRLFRIVSNTSQKNHIIDILNTIESHEGLEYLYDFHYLCLEICVILLRSGSHSQTKRHADKLYSRKNQIDKDLLHRIEFLLGTLCYISGHINEALCYFSNLRGVEFKEDLRKALLCCYLQSYTFFKLSRIICIQDIPMVIMLFLEKFSSSAIFLPTMIVSCIINFYITYKILKRRSNTTSMPSSLNTTRESMIPQWLLGTHDTLNEDPKIHDGEIEIPYLKSSTFKEGIKYNLIKAPNDKELQEKAAFGQMVQLQPPLQYTVFDSYGPLREYNDAFGEHDEEQNKNK
ncbi:developmentally-regulated membrane protein [Acrasis kona]|uniref:Developmentally-regulated membrane protein n=1 Tax=Acrasis kona TaxID=1008807 RepID=A0AAW2ZB03_9EUKA